MHGLSDARPLSGRADQSPGFSERHPETTSPPYRIVIAGATAGLVSRLQIATQYGPSASARSVLRSALQKEGLTVRNLSGIALLMTESMESTYLKSFGIADQDGRNVKKWQTFIGGGVAGTIATLSTYPFDLLRTRFAVQGDVKIYKSLAGAIKQIFAHEGVRGFYLGCSIAGIQVFPYMSLVFGLNDVFKDMVGMHMSSGWRDASAGFAAGTVAKLAVYPLDTLRKRYQIQGPVRDLYASRVDAVQGKSIMQSLKNIIAVEGVRGLYRGSTLAVVKAAPGTAVTLWTFEQTLKLLDRLENSK